MNAVKRRRTQAERSATTRARLMEATIECLVERGYPGTTTTDICRRAGLSRGAQLHHFPTKGDLVVAAVEYLFERRHEEFREMIGDLPGELDAAFAKLWEIYSGPTLTAYIELLVASRTDAPLRSAVARLNKRFEDDAEVTFRKVFGLGDDARVRGATRLLLSVFDGLAMNHVLEDDDVLAQQVLGVFKQLIEPWKTQGVPEDEGDHS